MKTSKDLLEYILEIKKLQNQLSHLHGDCWDRKKYYHGTVGEVADVINNILCDFNEFEKKLNMFYGKMVIDEAIEGMTKT